MYTSSRSAPLLFSVIALLFASVLHGELGTPEPHVTTSSAFGPGHRGAGDVLSLDDGTAEATFGVGLVAARQFLWFNQFTLTQAAQLEEVQVIFPAGPNMVVGDPIEIVVFVDDNADPTDGASLEVSLTDTIQLLETDFSRYPIDPPLLIMEGSSVLIGVVNRFSASGIDGPTAPAALDSSASQGRSWFATWTGDPPTPLSLPSDLQLAPVDVLAPGNWMIRGIVSAPFAIDIPTLDHVGLLTLVLALVFSGGYFLRRKIRGS